MGRKAKRKVKIRKRRSLREKLRTVPFAVKGGLVLLLVGSILGVGMLINAPLGFLSPIYAGWIFDTTGDYTIAFTTFAALLFGSTVVLLLLRPPAPPPQVTDIRELF